jgi:hypothetical protein
MGDERDCIALDSVRVLVLISLHTSEITLQHIHTEYRKRLKSSTSRPTLHTVYLELLNVHSHASSHIILTGSAGNLT